MKKENFKFAFIIISAIIVSLGLSVSIQSLLAWTAPTTTPPSGNVDAPVNVGSGAQVKSGVFGVTNDFYVGLNTFYADHMGSGNVGIGTTTPTYTLDIYSTDSNPSSNAALRLSGEKEVDLEIAAASDNYRLNPLISASRSRGTIASPANVQSNDTLFEIWNMGYYNSSFRESGSLRMDVDGTPAAYVPGKWIFTTNESGGNAHSMVFDSKGNLSIGTSTPYASLHVYGDGKTFRIGAGNDNLNASANIELAEHANVDGSLKSGVKIGNIGANGQERAFLHVLDNNIDKGGIDIPRTTGYVGIGTTSPVYPFSVVSDNAISNTPIGYFKQTGGAQNKAAVTVDVEGNTDVGYSLYKNGLLKWLINNEGPLAEEDILSIENSKGLPMLSISQEGMISIGEPLTSAYEVPRDSSLHIWSNDYVSSSIILEGNSTTTPSLYREYTTIKQDGSAIKFIDDDVGEVFSILENGGIRLNPVSTATCNASLEGSVYYDTEDSTLYVCTDKGQPIGWKALN